jgi:hypothetical protein
MSDEYPSLLAFLRAERGSRARTSSDEYLSLDQLSRALFPDSERDRMAFVARVMRHRAARGR